MCLGLLTTSRRHKLRGGGCRGDGGPQSWPCTVRCSPTSKTSSVSCASKPRGSTIRGELQTGSDQRKLYRLMDGLLQRKGHCSLPTHDSSKDLADCFCAFFTSKIDDLREKPITVDDQDTSSSPANTPALSTFTQVTDREVSKIVSASPAKSCCLDPLPTWFLKSLGSLVPTITAIVDESLGSGTFPAAFKSALVRPLLKKSTLDPEVYCATTDRSPT